ncbi:RNA polymerase sigma factor [Pedobacter steynii]|uniref:RNA polymerase subunit sigma-70 n=1 Tax=Pedobacter steynii TaxID=430522 RepID=A0A1D7QCM9_9SPHI|nr:RNA polymerase sigma-70 factor [Pedobacter steynii]AOM76309.1 RNA polymerase subunit sigma-70 [Pedobacter steynii]
MSYKLHNDQELTDLLKSDDRLAYAEIYKRYHAALYIHAFKRLQLREECRDLVHELFTTLWIKRQEITFKTTLSGYLYTSVRNKIFDLLARQKLKTSYTQSIQQFAETGLVTTDHLARQNQLKTLIDQEIANLPERTRQIFELSRKRFLSHQEIAKELNISEQTVKTTVNNALRVLRIKFGSMLFLSL